MTQVIITSMLQQNENQNLQANCFKTLALEYFQPKPLRHILFHIKEKETKNA